MQDKVNPRIVAPGSHRDTYLPLFYLADDSLSQVANYYQSGDLYVLDDASGPIGITLVTPVAPGEVELKAVAVEASRQQQGIGRRMLAAVLADLKRRGVQRVVVGTASAGTGQLAFYQKAGFRLRSVERDYFSPARGYPENLQENGIAVRDMVWMDQELSA